ncbi:RES family NAD+ phosphorylase [Thauera butanivorans]|uniref:RES family NAD+ phosphorylase n=1 Tax=Thauera butanivorans TaxID=86174 RepID=UPI003AB3ED87
MIHDPELLDRLDAFPKETFVGEVFRGTRQGLSPLASSYSGGRWMRRDGAGVLYTSLAREGALAEIAFHWGQLSPRPTKPVMLHTLRVVAHRTLKLVRADLTVLGVPENTYAGMNLPRTQEIGAAIEFLGCDGLIAPGARWACDNLILFPDRMGADATLEIVTSESIDWLMWANAHGLA